MIGPSDVLVLSAKLRFQQATLYSADAYDDRLGPVQAERLIARGPSGPNDLVGSIKPGCGMCSSSIADASRWGVPYRAVICAASGLYRQVLDAWAPEFARCGVITVYARRNQIAGGIGEQRAQLREFLNLYGSLP